MARLKVPRSGGRLLAARRRSVLTARSAAVFEMGTILIAAQSCASRRVPKILSVFGATLAILQPGSYPSSYHPARAPRGSADVLVS